MRPTLVDTTYQAWRVWMRVFKGTANEDLYTHLAQFYQYLWANHDQNEALDSNCFPVPWRKGNSNDMQFPKEPLQYLGPHCLKHSWIIIARAKKRPTSIQHAIKHEAMEKQARQRVYRLIMGKYEVAGSEAFTQSVYPSVG